jgi:hypothetical protein
MTFPTVTLPSRPLALARGVLSMPKAYYLSTPVLLLIVALMVIAEAPGILRDYKISGNPVVVEDGSIRDGKCTTRKAIFTTCNAKLGYIYNGQSYESDVEIMFVDLHSGDYETNLVISGDEPALATLSLGLDMLWNRIITLAIFAALLTGACVMMMFLALRLLLVWRHLRHPARLVALPVEITSVNNKGNRFTINYADKLSDRKTGRTALTRFERGQEPLIVGESGGKAVALAVWHGDTALPVLLDSRLERIALTDEERAAALAPLTEELTAIERQQASDLVDPAKKGPSLKKRLTMILLVILLIVGGFLGYWLWYVTSAASQFNSPGMDFNNMMPAPLNRWGCDQLKSRFGNDRAPFGCVAGDYTSWK